MTYKLPKKVRVGPFVYKFEQNRLADSEHRWAETSHLMRVIRFGELCKGRELPISLIHELVHAVESGYGLDLDEKTVCAVSHGLAQALMDMGLLPEEMELGG